jgi:hypothetical protein
MKHLEDIFMVELEIKNSNKTVAHIAQQYGVTVEEVRLIKSSQYRTSLNDPNQMEFNLGEYDLKLIE